MHQRPGTGICSSKALATALGSSPCSHLIAPVEVRDAGGSLPRIIWAMSIPHDGHVMTRCSYACRRLWCLSGRRRQLGCRIPDRRRLVVRRGPSWRVPTAGGHRTLHAVTSARPLNCAIPFAPACTSSGYRRSASQEASPPRGRFSRTSAGRERRTNAGGNACGDLVQVGDGELVARLLIGV